MNLLLNKFVKNKLKEKDNYFIFQNASLKKSKYGGIT